LICPCTDRKIYSIIEFQCEKPEGPLEEVLSSTTVEQFIVDASDNGLLADLLAEHDSVDGVDWGNDGGLVVTTDDPTAFALVRFQRLDV